MCGIVAVVAERSTRGVPSLSEIVSSLETAVGLLPLDEPELIEKLEGCAAAVEEADRLLRGVPGVRCIAGDPSARAAIEGPLARLEAEADRCERVLDATDIRPEDLEPINARVVRLRDALWSVRSDRLRTAAEAIDLAGVSATPTALAAFTHIQFALSAIDRLEVRGRDSAGLAVIVRDHGLTDGPVADAIAERAGDGTGGPWSIRVGERALVFIYKAAAEIGELGDNTRVLRGAIAGDPLLHRAVSGPRACVNVVGHTRWASVGMISEANAHPLDSDHGPVVLAALNGDIDNHADLREHHGIDTHPAITTDAKIIPVLTSAAMARGDDPTTAFRSTVASFDGSVAIAAAAADAPEDVMLALRGSGQALYVGIAEEAYMVASEPYGLVEQATAYLRMEGEASNGGARGQVVVLHGSRAGSVEGIERVAYDGTPLPVGSDELQVPEITTRDVDRGSHPHFLIKEINEAPRSIRRTLRGKVVDGRVVLGPEALPDRIADELDELRRIIVIGQGTAAVAGRAVAGAIRSALEPVAAPSHGSPAIRVEATAASELSGFGLREDMSDTLLVVISQSGTTTDTNRTVEVAKARGALVVAIVNRRQSDLVDRSDGVLYTSDGRDVEMAVPSTKAFYAQVAAGFLLAGALADRIEGAPGLDAELIRALLELPDAMEHVLSMRAEIADVARRHAPMRRYWAVVGNGMNRIAAEEVRIKLSELCYKSIACDSTEDKKHIDLSAEPLILVCAAGLSMSNAEDVAKEVAIYRAHNAAPIVIAGEGEGSYAAAFDVIRVPASHPDLAFVLSAMAGHLFGYEAALAIDAQALVFREARAAIEAASEADGRHDAHRVLERLRAAIEPMAARYNDGLRSGAYDGHLEASKAVRIASLFRYATGVTPLDAYQIEHGKVGTPSEVIGDLVDALTAGIDELTRPVDAIRHQAKTVTVGITRSDETLLGVPLVREVLAAGVPRDRLTYGTLRTLAALDPAVARVTGYTHYSIQGDVRGEATIQVTDRGGISRDIPSRVDRDPRLRGTKHRVAVEREVLVTRGRGDERTIVAVPEVKGPDTTGIVVMHVVLEPRLEPGAIRSVLEGYRDRYQALRDLVTETEPTFRDDLLAEVDVADLLIGSIQLLADRWRSGFTAGS